MHRPSYTPLCDPASATLIGVAVTFRRTEDGYQAVTKHGSPGEAGYRVKHPGDPLDAMRAAWAGWRRPAWDVQGSTWIAPNGDLIPVTTHAQSVADLGLDDEQFVAATGTAKVNIGTNSVAVEVLPSHTRFTGPQMTVPWGGTDPFAHPLPDAIYDDFGLGDLTDEELDELGILNIDDEEADDEPVVFVRTADAFTKAIRKPWREALHPRGFGGRFGNGTGTPQRRHAPPADLPDGLGRRDRLGPTLAPRVRLGLQEIPARLIHAGNNDRKEFDPAKLSELARSIDQDGIAFPPVVRPHPTRPGHFEIVGGERRVRAMRDVLGWDAVPVNVKNLNDEQASMMMLAENTVRDDLKPVDEARGYKTRMDQFGLTPEELAERTKMPVRRIKERLDLLTLEPQIQDMVNAGQLPLGHARLMRDLEFARQRIAMQTYNKGTPGGGTMTVATFRSVVAKLQNEQDQQGFGFDMSGFMVNDDSDAEKRAAAAAAEAAAAKRAKNREPQFSPKELAEKFGVKTATVQQWKARKHLPPPDHVFGGVPVWYESTLDGWKPPGRVRKMLRVLRIG